LGIGNFEDYSVLLIGYGYEIAELSIIPMSQNFFIIKGIDDAQLTFNTNEDEEIVSMTLHQHGMDNICKRLDD